jgi:hypothetical protein
MIDNINPITQQEAGRLRVAHLLSTYGCIPPAPDGPIVSEFNPRELARALEHELCRAKLTGWSKITLHMDIEDAVKLAKFLRAKGK